MQNIESWRPTKFVMRRGRLRATKDRAFLSVGSRLVAELVAEFYQNAFPLHARGRLLDMGCGAVPFYAAYRDHVDEVTCIDWTNSRHDISHLDRACDLTQAIPFPDESFDTILLSDVLEHLPEPDCLWREVTRLLAPGGKLIMNVPFYYQLHEEPHDYFRYTQFALERFADRSGLNVIDLKPVGGAPEILADLVSKLLAGTRAGVWPAAWVQSVAMGIGRTRFGARLSRRTSARFPFGYFMVAEKPRIHAAAA
jgi:SAM-dependent methyltransferase